MRWLILALAVWPAMAEQGFLVTPDGVRLHYRRVGNGPLAVVIPFETILYDALQPLKSRDRSLIFYDLRNRGRSAAVTDPAKIGIDADVRDLDAVRAHFRFERITAIGHSYLGTMVALYALRYPGRIDRLVQHAPTPMDPAREFPPDQIAPDRERVPDPQLVMALQERRARGEHRNNPRQFCLDEWSVMRSGLVGNVANAHRVSLERCRWPNEWPANLEGHFARLGPSIAAVRLTPEALRPLQAPVLVLHGTHDRNAPVGAGREWAASLPRGRLVVLKGAAHQSWVEFRAELLREIDRFLQGAIRD